MCDLVLQQSNETTSDCLKLHFFLHGHCAYPIRSDENERERGKKQNKTDSRLHNGDKLLLEGGKQLAFLAWPTDNESWSLDFM